MNFPKWLNRVGDPTMPELRQRKKIVNDVIGLNSETLAELKFPPNAVDASSALIDIISMNTPADSDNFRYACLEVALDSLIGQHESFTSNSRNTNGGYTKQNKITTAITERYKKELMYEVKYLKETEWMYKPIEEYIPFERVDHTKDSDSDDDGEKLFKEVCKSAAAATTSSSIHLDSSENMRRLSSPHLQHFDGNSH